MALWNKRDLFRIFAVCAFPIHVWAVVLMLKQVPSVMKWTGVWGAASLAAYTLTVALFESAILAGIVFLVAQIFPRRWEVSERVGQASLAFLILSLWLVIRRLVMIYKIPVETWQLVGLVLLAIYSIIEPALSLHRSSRFQSLLLAFVDRLTVLAAFYLLLDVAGLAVVIVRNLRGPL